MILQTNKTITHIPAAIGMMKVQQNKIEINESDLRKLYLDEKLQIKDIAKIYNCSRDKFVEKDIILKLLYI